MGYRIDINCDLGEGFGLYKLSNDEELIKNVSSINIACGFHAGDPHVMRATVNLAKKYNVQPGAHPGLPDSIGFGRRRMNTTPGELADYVVYQVGALNAFVHATGLRLQHVLIHGIACVMCWYEEEYARAYVTALQELDPSGDLILYGSRGGPGQKYVLEAIAKEAGLRVVPYLVVDMDYYSDGSLIMARTHEPVNVKERTNRVIHAIKKGMMKDKDGKEIPYQPKSLLVHSDTPNVIELLKNMRVEFEREDIEVVPVKEIV